MSLDVLFENQDLIICIKPPTVPSQPDPSGDEDMTALIRSHLSSKGEAGEVFVVHRLDRGVGGVMVYAKTKRACAYLSERISDKELFKKEYLAVVSGAPAEEQGTLEDYIYKDSKSAKAFIVKGARAGAKRASLDYSILQSVKSEDKSYSLLKIKLNTGRYHQIRVQLASRGLPICGDGKYGSREKTETLCLWSYSLSFDYNGKRLSFCKTPDVNKKIWNLFDIK